MALNMSEMWSNGIKIAFVFQKIKKKLFQWLAALPQDLYSLPRIYFANLSPLFSAKSWLRAKPGFWSSILRYLRPTKSSFFENFWWRHSMWFVICPPQSKILATRMGQMLA